MATTSLRKKPKPARSAAKGGESSLEVLKHFDRLEKSLRGISDRLARVDSLNRTLWIPIESFYPEPYRVKHPFTAVVAPEEDEFVASWFDANIHASGDTEEQAVASLKSVILDSFDRLSEMTDRELSTVLRKQRDILRSHVAAQH